MAQLGGLATDINLLPGDDLETRSGGRFLKWALSWGKKIVVITELVVILAFLSRFWLDTTVADLSEKIEQKRAIILSSAEFEAKFRTVASRLNQAKKIEQQVSPVVVLREARKLIPKDIEVSTINVNDKTVSFVAITDEKTLARLVENFRSTTRFDDVIAEKVSKVDQNSNVGFSFRANYRG